MNQFRIITNPGSAIGEAVGASMEKALSRLLTEVADEYGCYYLTSGVRKTKSGRKVKKLLLADSFGNEYDIDGVLANESMQPLIIFESKYIRYKKHNRDKGSWVCHAHSAIRKRYHSIRSSIAVLAGNWSNSSIAMMKSHDINLFIIPFEVIIHTLAEFGVDFNWAEKEQDKAHEAWMQFDNLPEARKDQLGEVMITMIKDDLLSLVERILDDSIRREIEKIVLELVSNLGEVKVFEFDSIEEAVDFLEQENLDQVFLTVDSVTLYDPPPEYEV